MGGKNKHNYPKHNNRNNNVNRVNNVNNNNMALVVRKKTKFTYTQRLEAILLDISDNISHTLMAAWMTENELGYKMLDMCDKPNLFRAQMDNKTVTLVNIHAFLDAFFNKKFHINEINRFIIEYNKRIPLEDNREYFKVAVSAYDAENFEYKPTDIYYTFNSLCHQTYPHGTEEKVLKYMPVPGLTQDNYGNYYVIVGESDTMFTSHLDSACRQHEKVHLLRYTESGELYIISNGKTILSADDKAGVTIMLYMIANEVPGLYYFFLGEERGGIGSGLLASDFALNDHLKGINKCISFDRRNYYSVITHQGSRRCCSDTFAISLCEELNKNGMKMKLDNGGLFTDSANFIEHIPECTNISVGYFNEHSTDEVQNITFLYELCKACIGVDWANLKVNKQAIVSKDILSKHEKFIKDLRQLKLYCSSPALRAYESSPDSVFVEFRLSSSFFKAVFDDIKAVSELTTVHDLDETNIVFTEDRDGTILMNVELK
jgi:hypothetical protein